MDFLIKVVDFGGIEGCTAAEAEELADRLAPLDLPAKGRGKSQQKVTWAKLLSQVSKVGSFVF